MAIKDSLLKFEEIIKDRDQKHSEFIKNLLVISSAALGILASLHKTQSTTEMARLSFAVTVVSLTVGILSGAFTLYRHVHSSQKIYEGLRDAIVKQLQTNSPTFEPVIGQPSNMFFYKLAEGVYFFSLCVAVLSLCIYAISIN